MCADNPISRELLHWESQANTAQHHADSQNLIHHVARGYTILVFARGQKKKKRHHGPFKGFAALTIPGIANGICDGSML